MSNIHNLIPQRKGEPGRNPNGRPKGARNRSTIAREVLDLDCTIPDEVRADLEGLFPNLPKQIKVEHLATLVQMSRAIAKGDTRAYMAVLDSAYGRATQPIDIDAQIGSARLLSEHETMLLAMLREASISSELDEQDDLDRIRGEREKLIKGDLL